jgi:nitrate/nitrite transport system permease protein
VTMLDEVLAPAEGSAPPGPAPPPPRTRTLTRGASNVAWGLVGAAVVVVAWQLAAARVAQLPTPAETLEGLRELLSSPFNNNGPNDRGVGLLLLGSLQRVFSGFVLAAAVGIPLGLAIGASRRVWQAANPMVQLLRPVSPLAWFPIWLVVFRDAPRAAIWVIFITSLWPIVLNTAAGVGSIPNDHRNVARVFRFGRWSYIRHVLIPGSLPSIVTGLRLSMGIAWMVIVAVEMLSGGTGIGFFVWDSYNALNLANVIAAIVLIGVVGVLLDLAFLRLFRAVALDEVRA